MDNRESRGRGRARGRSRGAAPDGDGARQQSAKSRGRPSTQQQRQPQQQHQRQQQHTQQQQQGRPQEYQQQHPQQQQGRPQEYQQQHPQQQQGRPQEYQQQHPQQQQGPPQQQAHQQPSSSGDLPAATRGVPRRPGTVSGVTRDMSGMQLQPVMLGSRRQFDPSLFDPKTKPAHIQSSRGKSGQPIKLVANFFPMSCARDWVLHQYRVDFNPEVDHRGARRGMLRDHKEMLGNFMFDGSMLFTIRRLPDKSTEVFSTRRSDGEKIRITIQHTTELPANSPISLQVYNIVFRRVLEMLGMKQVGRNYYNPSLATVVDCQRVKFELWPGFLTSILQYERKPMLCIEISHKLMRKESVLDVIIDMSRQRGPGSFQERVSKFLIGQVVLTRYNNNTYRIDGIEWNLTVSHTFERRGQPISYVDYYKEQYNLTITDTRQPLLLSRPKKREIRRGGLEVVHLIPELCSVTGLTDELRSDFHVMKRLGEHTKQGPEKRATSLVNFTKKMLSNNEIAKEFKEWGLELNPNLLRLDCRTLEPEPVYFEGEKKVNPGPKASWDYELRNVRMVRSVPLEQWILIHTKRDEEIANDFATKLIQAARGLGFNVKNPFKCRLDSDHAGQYQGAIKNVLQKQKGMQMVACMLPSNRKDRYDAIKKLCCVDMPIPSQVVLARTLAKGGGRAMSVCTKIAIQMNCKLGGEAWRVHNPLKTTMMIGVDTYHDSSQKGRSVAGFVASINAACTRWYSNVTFQEAGQELSDGLMVCMRGALVCWKRFNHGVLPTRVIVYRDGVGDGQLDHLLGYEIPQYLNCFSSMQEDYRPTFTFIVVKKRINARFFHLQGNRLDNPPPGTVVDNEVTRPEWYDFYVVSQSVREGTVSPTHYNVIFDNSGLIPDHLQMLSYKLCHLYYNWAGTIRVPAPCLYAHKLAFLVGQSVHTSVSPALCDRLYFL